MTDESFVAIKYYLVSVVEYFLNFIISFSVCFDTLVS